MSVNKLTSLYMNKSKYLNCQFEVLHGDEYFLDGKIYNVIDGYIFNPLVGYKLPLTRPPFRTFRDLRNWFTDIKELKNRPYSRWDTLHTVQIKEVE